MAPPSDAARALALHQRELAFRDLKDWNESAFGIHDLEIGSWDKGFVSFHRIVAVPQCPHLWSKNNINMRRIETHWSYKVLSAAKEFWYKGDYCIESSPHSCDSDDEHFHRKIDLYFHVNMFKFALDWQMEPLRTMVQDKLLFELKKLLSNITVYDCYAVDLPTQFERFLHGAYDGSRACEGYKSLRDGIANTLKEHHANIRTYEPFTTVLNKLRHIYVELGAGLQPNVVVIEDDEESGNTTPSMYATVTGETCASDIHRTAYSLDDQYTIEVESQSRSPSTVPSWTNDNCVPRSSPAPDNPLDLDYIPSVAPSLISSRIDSQSKILRSARNRLSMELPQAYRKTLIKSRRHLMCPTPLTRQPGYSARTECSPRARSFSPPISDRLQLQSFRVERAQRRRPGPAFSACMECKRQKLGCDRVDLIDTCGRSTSSPPHPSVFNMTIVFHNCVPKPKDPSRLVTEVQGCTNAPINFTSYSASVATDQKYQVGPSPAPGCILYFYPQAGCAAPSRNDVVFEEVKKKNDYVVFKDRFIAKSYLLQCNHFKEA
ncbi:hypothetical protein FH972_026908 [Carpinus fangiana]|uniref:Uncharacterized protein n=1 Tax=Carpinus fangiana TaxID=176857 RepID=A0A5N6L5M4_9ROSI|nr:hypothetical protein FH972_026908 [Carpinus fangiana]